MKCCKSVNEAVRQIEAFEGRAEDFRLVIDHSLFDPVGVNIALITDAILARDWWPDDFSDQDGCRIYRYKTSND